MSKEPDNLLDEADCSWRAAAWIAGAWLPGQIAMFVPGAWSWFFRILAGCLIITSLGYAKKAHKISRQLHKEEDNGHSS